MTVLMVFVFTACGGSEEDGTRGMIEGRNVTVKWSKALLNDSIKLSIESDSIDDSYIWSLNTDNWAGLNEDIPVTLEKTESTGKMKLKISPIMSKLEAEDEENGAGDLFVSFRITCDRGAGEMDQALDMVITCQVSNDIHLAVSVPSFDDGISLNVINPDDPHPLALGEGAKTQSGDNMLVVTGGGKGIWGVGDYDAKVFEIDPPRIEGEYTIIHIRPKKTAMSDIVIVNSLTGETYTIYAATKENVEGQYTMAVSDCKLAYSETSMYDTPGMDGLLKDNNTGIDESKISLPAGMSSVSVTAYNADFSDEGDASMVFSLLRGSEKWNYIVSGSLGTDDLSAFYEDWKDNSKYAENTLDVKGVEVKYITAEEVAACIWTENDLCYSLEGFGIEATEEDIVNMLSGCIGQSTEESTKESKEE